VHQGAAPQAGVSLTRRKQFFFVVVSFLAVAVFLAVRIGPWNPEDKLVRIEPGGTFFEKHPTLSYTHIRGSSLALPLSTGIPT
jgi:hypothetical protein